MATATKQGVGAVTRVFSTRGCLLVPIALDGAALELRNKTVPNELDRTDTLFCRGAQFVLHRFEGPDPRRLEKTVYSQQVLSLNGNTFRRVGPAVRVTVDFDEPGPGEERCLS